MVKQTFRFGLFIFTGLLIFNSCEDKKDTTPPEVTITSPINGSTVNEIVTITCISTDNKGVEKVELWVDGVSTTVTDESEPYSLDWNTTTYDDGNHVITVRSYDNSGNMTDSKPVTLIIDNTVSNPTPVDIVSITYDTTQMTIIRYRSGDTDFENYEILISESENGDKKLLQTIKNISDTSFVLTEFNPLEPSWYWIRVTDIFGYSSLSNGYYILETPPNPVILYPISYKDNSFFIRWSQNDDEDFSLYKLYEGLSENMSGKTEIISYDVRTDTTFVITKIEQGVKKYYQIVTQDKWGLESVSNIELCYSYHIFIKNFGGDLRDTGSCVQQTSDGGYIIIGGTYSFGNGADDVWLIKTDSQGNEEWNKTFGGSDRETGKFINQTNDNGYIIVCYTYSYETSDRSVWLIKTDSNGNEEWNKTFGDSGYDIGFSVQQTTDGGYIIVGETKSVNSYDVWLIKTDSNGNEEWNKTYDGGKSDVGYSVQQTSDGGFVIVGKIYSNNVNAEGIIWLIKTDLYGDKEWDNTFGVSVNYNDSRSVQQTTDGGYIIVGETKSVNSYDVWLIKTDSNGNEEWNKMIGNDDEGGNDEEGNFVQQTTDGGYIIVGNIWKNGSESDVLLIKTDLEGNIKP